MEHVEEAGVHSGDSACAIPPQTLPDWVVEVITLYTTAIANRLDVRGLINVQYAVLNQAVFVIEANPRRAARCRSSPRRGASRSPRWRPA